MSIGEKIRQLRNRKKMKQKELAKLIGMHESHIGRYEKDQSVPNANALKKIAQVFNVSADYLLFDKDNELLSTKILDQELLKHFEIIDKMDNEKKETVKKILSMVINEDKIKKMVS